MTDFFISYNQADRSWAEWIAWQLEEAGYTTVLQAWDFRPGTNFVLEMQRAAQQAERTIAVLSPDYLTAGFTQPEWAAAFARDPTGEKGTLLPIRVQECDLQGLLPQIIYVDLVGMEEEAARENLLTGARPPEQRSKPPAPPPFPPTSERPRFPGSAEEQEEARTGPSIALDLSHGQTGWRRFVGALTSFARSNPDMQFVHLEGGFLRNRQELESCSALMVALPRNATLADAERDYVQTWVEAGRGLFLLGYYMADSHHEMALENQPRGLNINSLARMFDFEFSDDLIMPLGRCSELDCRTQPFRYSDVELSVTVQVPESAEHPIVQGVTELAFLSASSLSITQEPAFVLHSPPSAVMHALGQKDPQGRRIHIDRYDKTRQDTVPLLAAWHHGNARIAAVSTWKICMQTYGDNAKLVKNILNWLTSPAGAVHE